MDSKPLEVEELRKEVLDFSAGGYTSFEGWVRNLNEGKKVLRLEYQSYEVLAIKEGQKIVQEALEKFDITKARCVHRVGQLELGQLAVWIGVSAEHRGPAFEACQYIINQVKIRVPIWKREHYVDEDPQWVECHHCAKHANHAAT